MARKSSFDSQSIDTLSITNTRSEQSNTRSEAQKERVSIACTYCRYRKVKCDGGKPSCSFCVHTGRSECDYAKVSEEENQHSRRRKRELRARRAAERLRAEQEQNAFSQSPSSSAFILNNLDSSSPQSKPERRRASVPKRSRKRSMASGSVTSQSTPNIFSSSAPSQINEEFPPEMALSGVPAELTNISSSNFLNLPSPQSNTRVANVEMDANSYTFPPTSMNSTLGFNEPNLDWAFGALSSSALASTSMLVDQRQDEEHSQQLQQAEQKSQVVPPRSIFALAASNGFFLDSMTGTLGMTIPDFKGPTLAMANARPSNEVHEKDEVRDRTTKKFLLESEKNSTSPQMNQMEQNDPLFTDMQRQLRNFSPVTSIGESKNLSGQDFTAAKRRFSNVTEKAQAIFSLWPTSPFHPDQGKQASVPSPNEPSSMPELKRFLCTRNNPFSFNPVTPLAMSVPSSERNLYNYFTNFATSSSS